jgi:4-amino-4-deoxy-L-arabinose transferase-like glycosyltransferase
VFIVAAGILVRIIYNIEVTNSIFLGNYILDSLHYHTWATKILAGETENLAFFRAPLYPYLVALLYKIFGVSPWPVIVFQNLLGLLTAVVSYQFAKRVFGLPVAFWTGLIVAVYPMLIYFEGETLTTSVEVFLYTVAIYRLFIAVQQPAAGNVIKAGFLLGLAAIARPTILPVAVVFPIAFLFKYGIHAIKDVIFKSLIMAAAALIPILPVTLTNLVKGGEFVLIATQGGANFYIGNSKEADGITVIAPGPQMRLGPYNDNVWTSSMDEAVRRTGRKMSQSEVSSFWFREALKEIGSDVGRAVRLYFKKFYLFWHGQEIFNQKPVYYAAEYSRLISVLVWKKLVNFPSGFLFPLMFIGILLAFRNKQPVLVPSLYIIIYALLVSAFFVCARFRQPILPVAVMLAAYAVVTFIRLWGENKRLFLSFGAVLVLLITGLNWGGDVESKINLSQFYATIGSAYVSRNEYESGIAYLEKALEILPDNIAIFDMAGQAYLNSGKIKEAEEIYQKGVAMFPTYPTFNFNLGRICQMREDFEKAKEYYRITLQVAPKFMAALDRMAGIFEQQNQLDSALYYYKQLARYQPTDSRLKAKIKSLEQLIEGSR